LLTTGDGIALFGILMTVLVTVIRVFPSSSKTISVMPDCDEEHRKLLELIRLEIKIAVRELMDERGIK
jgi:hypothetical protein